MTSNLHSAWARIFVRAVATSGIRDLVVSPGSRSTPLVLAASDEPGLRLTVIVDERVAAFYALGQARATGRPTALLCTSGTAPAHYYPAVIEASASYLPLLVLTADRPFELHDAGAQQTIDQVRLFGAHVRHFVDVGAPDMAALGALPRIAANAVTRTVSPTPGPVHVNLRFRKPLEPVVVRDPEPWQPHADVLRERGAPRLVAPRARIDEEIVDDLAARCQRARRGLIVCGPRFGGPAPATFRDALADLARRTGFPILAEATSQARFGVDADVCGAIDVLFGSSVLRGAAAPELILELGAPPIAGRYQDFLADHPQLERVGVSAHGYPDPTGTASTLIAADPADFCAALSRRLRERSPCGDAGWSSAIRAADAHAWLLIDRMLADEPFGEPAAVRAVVDACANGATLVVGNGLPVRHVDAWCPPSRCVIDVFHQRGASGIDGLVAGAAGAASVREDRVTLLVGDVSAVHDLGGLHAAAVASSRVNIVVLDNGGGRIFEQLPVRSCTPRETFERLFITAQRTHWGRTAEAFGIPFVCAASTAQIARAFEQARAERGPFLVQARVDGPLPPYCVDDALPKEGGLP